MKIALYPGSFNPWHEGHEDVLNKAISIFDEVCILQLTNSDKGSCVPLRLQKSKPICGNITFYKYDKKLLVDVVNKFIENRDDDFCIIKGLRNAQDLEYETVQQYWNEDLGIDIPIVYFICDRNLRHISSSAIKAVQSFKKK